MMKKSLLLMLVLVANFAFAQENFDRKAERKKLSKEIRLKYDKISSLYQELYDEEGNERAEIKTEIEALEASAKVESAKIIYLFRAGVDNVGYTEAEKLRFFRKAENLFAAVVAKDSKGQMISHESVNELINRVHEKNLEEKYGCYDNDDQSDDVQNAQDNDIPYDESHKEIADAIMQTLGYANYQEMRDENYKTYCAIESVSFDNTQSPLECGNFLSEMRISFLAEVERRVKHASSQITAIGYQNATDDMFTTFLVLNDIETEVQEQVQNIEALCIDNKFDVLDSDFFDYIESEASKGGISIENIEFNTKSDEDEKEINSSILN
jgi:hypothetical protein